MSLMMSVAAQRAMMMIIIYVLPGGCQKKLKTKSRRGMTQAVASEVK